MPRLSPQTLTEARQRHLGRAMTGSAPLGAAGVRRLRHHEAQRKQRLAPSTCHCPGAVLLLADA